MGLRKLLLSHTFLGRKSAATEKPLPIPPTVPFAPISLPPVEDIPLQWPYTPPPQAPPQYVNYGWPYVINSPFSSPSTSPAAQWMGNSMPEGDSYFTYKPIQHSPPALDISTPGFPYATPSPPCDISHDIHAPGYPYTPRSTLCRDPPSAWSTSSALSNGSTISLSSKFSSSSTLCETPNSSLSYKKSPPPSPLRPALKRRGASTDGEGPTKPKNRVSFRNPIARTPVLIHPLFARSSPAGTSPPPSPPLSPLSSPILHETPSTEGPSSNEASEAPLPVLSSDPGPPHEAIPQPLHRAPIAYDVSCPPSIETLLDWCGDRIPRQTLLEPATEPPVHGRLLLDCQDGTGKLRMPWKVEVWAGGNVRDSGGTQSVVPLKESRGDVSVPKARKFYLEESDDEDEDAESPFPTPTYRPTARYGGVVTNLDVLHSLYGTLNKPIRAFEWDSLDAESQKKVYTAYKARCAAGGKGSLEDGVKRVDWLQGRNVFAGVESLKADYREVEEEGAIVGKLVFREEEAIMSETG